MGYKDYRLSLLYTSGGVHLSHQGGGKEFKI